MHASYRLGLYDELFYRIIRIESPGVKRAFAIFKLDTRLELDTLALTILPGPSELATAFTATVEEVVRRTRLGRARDDSCETKFGMVCNVLKSPNP